MMDNSSFLNNIAKDSLYAEGASGESIKYAFKVFKKFLVKGNILELGPAEGVMTKYLYELGWELTLVEGAKAFCEQLRNNYPQATVEHSLFENYNPKTKFSNIILGHVLEHVSEPTEVLTLVKSWLSDDGVVIAAVPNARSLHRQAAVMMGLLQSEDTLNELDKHHGHLRIYNPESFRKEFLAVGFTIEHFGGYWLKPVSNKQIQDSWNPKMLNAFMQLGERYPDIAAEIYVVVKK